MNNIILLTDTQVAIAYASVCISLTTLTKEHDHYDELKHLKNILKPLYIKFIKFDIKVIYF